MGLGFPQILLTSHWLERRVRLVTAICMLSTDAWRRERAYCPLVVLEVLASHSVTSDTTLAGAWTILAVADCHNITSSHVFLHFKLFWPIHKVDRRVMYVCAQLLQLCLTLCDPVDCSLRDSSAHGILQARILERVAIPFSRGSSQPRDWTHVLLWLLHCRQILHCWATGEAKKKSWSKFIRNCVCLRIRTEDAPSAFWSLRPRKEVSWEREKCSVKNEKVNIVIL